MISYHAMLDVPRELVRYLSRLLAAERRARGTRRATRAGPDTATERCTRESSNPRPARRQPDAPPSSQTRRRMRSLSVRYPLLNSWTSRLGQVVQIKGPMVGLLRAYSKRADLLSDLGRTASSLQRWTEEVSERRLSVRSSGRVGRVWALDERLSEDQEREIVSAFLAGESKARIAERYKISPKSVQRVMRKRGVRRSDRRDHRSRGS